MTKAATTAARSAAEEALLDPAELLVDAGQLELQEWIDGWLSS